MTYIDFDLNSLTSMMFSLFCSCSYYYFFAIFIPAMFILSFWKSYKGYFLIFFVLLEVYWVWVDWDRMCLLDPDMFWFIFWWDFKSIFMFVKSSLFSVFVEIGYFWNFYKGSWKLEGLFYRIGAPDSKAGDMSTSLGNFPTFIRL